MKIVLLRLGHRIFRDKRLTAHVFLSARALGCEKGYYTGQKDAKLESTISKTSEQWGGNFFIEHLADWKRFVKDFRGTKVHMTVYGLPVQDVISRIRKSNELLLIVGGEKVPPEMYHAADYNVSVTSQPHSEVSALAVFLHELFNGKELHKEFSGKMKIIPQERGKKVVTD